MAHTLIGNHKTNHFHVQRGLITETLLIFCGFNRPSLSRPKHLNQVLLLTEILLTFKRYGTSFFSLFIVVSV